MMGYIYHLFGTTCSNPACDKANITIFAAQFLSNRNKFYRSGIYKYTAQDRVTKTGENIHGIIIRSSHGVRINYLFTILV